MIFGKYKKTFSYLGIILILAPFLFFQNIPKANATVPVLDEENLMVNEEIAGYTGDTALNTGSLVEKEFSLDLIVWALVKALIKVFIDMVIKWIKTGDMDIFGENGVGTMWIQSVKRGLQKEIIRASGVWLEKYLDPAIYDLLCEPWKRPIFNLLRQRSRKLILKDSYMPKCTLLDVIANAEGMARYMNNFQEGGWKAWFSMLERSENNPVGAYFDAASEMEAATARAEEDAKTEAVMNQGYIGQKFCELMSPEGTYCEEITIDSPGKWIGDELAMHTSSELRTLEIADEIDELFAAVAGLVVSWVSEGVGGNSSSGPLPMPSTGPVPIPPSSTETIVRFIDAALEDETNYIGTLSQAITTTDQALGIYEPALTCYTSYLNAINSCTTAGGTPARRPGQIQPIINYINSQIGILNTSTGNYNSEITRAEDIIIQLEDLRTRIEAATTIEEFEALRNEYTTLQASLHTPSDISRAGGYLRAARNAVTDAQTQFSNCANLPAACVMPVGPAPTP